MTIIEPLYDKKCTCLLCQTNFTTKKVRSRFIKVKKYDTDFFPQYIEHNPLLYYINVCPACGFSFSDGANPSFSQEGKLLLMEKICSQWVHQSFGNKRTEEDSLKAYKLASYCALLRKEKHISIAGLYIRIAWLYRIINNKEQEMRFMKLSLSEYELSYSTGDFKGTQVSELKTMYLIGELSRRTGQIEQATRYYSKVIEQQSRTVETKIVQLAKEGWHQIKELQKT
jgi:uncharacterized protein (DUF2225 family)